MPPSPPVDAKAQRLARALRENLRRRKAQAPGDRGGDPTRRPERGGEAVSRVGDGADDAEGLYPHGRGPPDGA